jgi:hypothetical protein
VSGVPDARTRDRSAKMNSGDYGEEWR